MATPVQPTKKSLKQKITKPKLQNSKKTRSSASSASEAEDAGKALQKCLAAGVKPAQESTAEKEKAYETLYTRSLGNKWNLSQS